MKSLFTLNKYFWKYRFRLGLGVVFIIISNLFSIYPIQVIRIAFDTVLNSVKWYDLLDGFQIQGDVYQQITHMLILFSMLVIGLSVAKGIFLFMTRMTIIVMSRLIEYDMKNEIFNHYQNLSLSFYKKNNTGDLMNRISEDVSRTRMYFGPAVMYTINLVVLFTLVITTMLQVNVKLTLYVLTPLPLLSISIYYASHIINKKSERVQRQLSQLSTFVQEAFSGIRVIKAYTQQSSKNAIFENELEIYRDKTLSLVKVNAVFMPLMILMIGLSTILTIFIGGKLAIAGEISMGNIAEFVIYVNMLTWPVASVGWVTSLVQRAAASQERINEFLLMKPEIENLGEAKDGIRGDIEFRNVSFTYPNSNIEALKDVSFKVNAGDSLAILGRTGAGKSTIASLLVRLYDIDKGQILIDGRDIKEIDLNLLRQSFGTVPQEVFLFSDTITNNIAFGKITRSAELSEVQEAARMAEIHEDISNFPNDYETTVGERGITLSGGQKQRISIARAIMSKPQLYIFDDCLSAVDTETENKIINNLQRVMDKTTSIIITHRVSSAIHCDHIIVLGEGEITESGNHSQLVANNGFYADSYEQQLLSKEEV
ncbi:MAG: ABC transporter [Crocinitomicaceae bacterium]|nr:ABC transporter [Crocinitomicaceae bacterium]|tara:strand:- start:1629 stop:3419 length:1791 start_codon:yes stop_codon:yes gene_type:complete